MSESGWVVAVTDDFGPTLYLTSDERWVWGASRHEARVFSDDEKQWRPRIPHEEWKPASDLSDVRSAERST